MFFKVSCGGGLRLFWGIRGVHPEEESPANFISRQTVNNVSTKFSIDGRWVIPELSISLCLICRISPHLTTNRREALFPKWEPSFTECVSLFHLSRLSYLYLWITALSLELKSFLKLYCLGIQSLVSLRWGIGYCLRTVCQPL